jgi:thiamine kinase-like enzyme
MEISLTDLLQIDEGLKVFILEYFGEQDIKISKIEGISNDNYLIERDTQKCILKIYKQNSYKNRDLEIKIMELVYPLGIAPKILFKSKQNDILIFQYIEQKKIVDKCDYLQEVADVLRKMHHLTMDGAEISPYTMIRDNILECRKKNIPLPNYIDRLLKRMEKIESKTKNIPSIYFGLCHNDLFGGNILYDGSVKIIDWEFSSMGDIFYDLAAFCLYLPNNEKQYFLKCYFEKTSFKIYRQFNQMIFIVNFLVATSLSSRCEKNGNNSEYYRSLALPYFNKIRYPQIVVWGLKKLTYLYKLIVIS